MIWKQIIFKIIVILFISTNMAAYLFLGIQCCWSSYDLDRLSSLFMNRIWETIDTMTRTPEGVECYKITHLPYLILFNHAQYNRSDPFHPR